MELQILSLHDKIKYKVDRSGEAEWTQSDFQFQSDIYWKEIVEDQGRNCYLRPFVSNMCSGERKDEKEKIEPTHR